MLWGTTGLMLGADDPKNAGQLVVSKPADLSSVVPPSFGYDALPPSVESVYSYETLIGGYGQRMHTETHPGPSQAPTRYYYGLNVDTSCGVPWLVGPAVTMFSPTGVDAESGVTQFFEVANSLFCLNGRRCNYRANDSSWPVSKDFGAGKAALQGIGYYWNNGPGNRAYVGMGDTEPVWRFSAASVTTVWDQPDANLFARDFVANGTELWRATAVNQVSKCDINADPSVLANWNVTDTFTIGDKQYPINRLATTVKGNLIILKTDGVYTIEGAGDTNPGLDHNLYPYLHLATSNEGGKYVGYWLNEIYLGGYGNTGLQIKPTIMLGQTHLPVNEIGPERIVDNDSPIHGELTASCGHETFNLYQAIWNYDTSTSYILKFGGWAQDPAGVEPVRLNVWHGSITAAIAGKKVTAMFKSTFGADPGHSRMYLGFSDGTIGWFSLPCTVNPAGCSSYHFSTDPGTLYFSIEDLGFRNDPKTIKALTVSGLNLNATSYALAQYQLEPGGGWTTLATQSNSPIPFNTTPKQKAWLPTAPGSTLPQFALVLQGVGGASPQITGLGIHYAIRMPPVYQYTFSVLADQVMLKRNGTPLRLHQSDIRDLIRSSVGVTPPTLVTFADQTIKQISVIDYEEVQSWSELLHQWSAAVKVTAVDFTPTQLAIYGTLDRLAQYTLDQLAAYSLDQLTSL